MAQSHKVWPIEQGCPYIQLDYENDAEMPMVIENLTGSIAIFARGKNPNYGYGKGVNYRLGCHIKKPKSPLGEFKKMLKLCDDRGIHIPEKVWVIATETADTEEIWAELEKQLNSWAETQRQLLNKTVTVQVFYGEKADVAEKGGVAVKYSTEGKYKAVLPCDPEEEPTVELVGKNPDYKFKA